MEKARDHSYKRILIERYCLAIISKLKKGEYPNSAVAFVLLDCYVLLLIFLFILGLLSRGKLLGLLTPLLACNPMMLVVGYGWKMSQS